MLTKELETVVAALTSAGGKPYVVGGAVRDMILGKKPKDMDVEVYGLGPEEIVTVLKKFGRVDQVGVSFGVIKLKMGKNEYDISLPRRESKAGTGHKGFIVKPDPSMTLEEACSRRDFTINAMAYCPNEAKVLDFYGGQSDLEKSVLRHTSPAFAEDPLRVLRGFQFAGRLNLSVDPETAKLCESLKREFPTLAKERIWGEWEKWALKSTAPHAGIRFLRETGWDQCFPGVIGSHTVEIAVARAHLVMDSWESEADRILTLLGTVCLHLEDEGYLEKFLAETLGAPVVYQKKLAAIFRQKTVPFEATAGLGRGKTLLTYPGVRRLAVDLEPATIQEAYMVLMGVTDDDKQRASVGEIANLAEDEEILNGKPKPMLTGKHLLEAGIKPGPEMGKILKAVYEAQLDGTVWNPVLALDMGLDLAKRNTT